MNAQDQTLDLLRQRVERVAEVSALTAKALKLTQALSGVEMDILRLELEIGRSAPSQKLARELQDTEDKVETQRKAHADCMEEIAAVETEVAALDRMIAATRGG
ncbi:hypothetical protein OIU34_14860 [Pararhizobium sp. BT-229]|uniref:hypothetical protein n=1 Tax=Pararhizobium sp. BT-229 TaxID=2986923 RepID=UPI0021F7F3DA|nr:hypothetical protein [Pararhizobium sp. BT-229]MCV9963187.1 hypothetical protein [Pararhizobium sp. BT-229]